MEYSRLTMEAMEGPRDGSRVRDAARARRLRPQDGPAVAPLRETAAG